MKDLDIKEIWKAGADDEPLFSYSKREVDQLIEQGSTNLISKFVKTLRIEQTINVVTLLILAIHLLYEGQFFVGASILLINGLFYYYYQRLKTNLKREYSEISVVQYLIDTKALIKRFIKHYKIATIVLAVISVGLAEFLKREGFYGLEDEQKFFYPYIMVALIVAIPVTYYGIYLMYGKKANKLEQMIHSLQEEESEGLSDA